MDHTEMSRQCRYYRLHGFAPFNIQNIGGSLFVTYAKQDSLRHDDVAGEGLGFVDIFSTSGKLQGHLEHGDWFNSPWGVVWTPRDFGEFSNVILVGNFGSGKIAAFNGFTKKFIGFVRNADNSIVTIDGLWSLTFANNGTAGSSTTDERRPRRRKSVPRRQRCTPNRKRRLERHQYHHHQARSGRDAHRHRLICECHH